MTTPSRRVVRATRVTRGLAGIALAATLSSQLVACFPVAVAGIAVGTMAAVDRRTVGAQTDDQTINLRSEARISERFGDRVHVNVNSYNRRVLLTGEVPDAAARTAVQTIVSGVDNVTAIVNELEISAPTALTARANDTFITGQVKASLIDAKDLYASAFKVTTERGVVYLQGRVTQREGDRATSIVRNQRGVQRVVKVLEYITEEELQRLVAQPAPPDNSTGGPGNRLP